MIVYDGSEMEMIIEKEIYDIILLLILNNISLMDD